MNQLESFHIATTRTTPEINFDGDQRLLEFLGVSSPENTMEFYRPIFELVEQIAQDTDPKLHLDMKLVHFNSSSAKVLFDLLQKIEAEIQNGQVKVDWYCDEDDDDMIEAAEDFSDLLDLEINILIKEEI